MKGEHTYGGVGVLGHVEGDVGHRGERSSTTGEPVAEVCLARLGLLGPGWTRQGLLGPGWTGQGLLRQDQDQEEDRTIPPPSKLSSIS